jgi:hypothetical protein
VHVYGFCLLTASTKSQLPDACIVGHASSLSPLRVRIGIPLEAASSLREAGCGPLCGNDRVFASACCSSSGNSRSASASHSTVPLFRNSWPREKKKTPGKGRGVRAGNVKSFFESLASSTNRTHAHRRTFRLKSKQAVGCEKKGRAWRTNHSPRYTLRCWTATDHARLRSGPALDCLSPSVLSGWPSLRTSPPRPAVPVPMPTAHAEAQAPRAGHPSLSQ